MTDDYNYEIDPNYRHEALQRRRYSGWLGFAAALLVIAGVSWFLWINHDALVKASVPPVAAETVAADDAVSKKDFEALQLRNADAMKSMSDVVEGQRAEIRRLGEQVATLTATVSTLQTSTASVQPTAPPRPAVVAPPRRVPPPRPAGSISVGGAPLPPTAGR